MCEMCPLYSKLKGKAVDSISTHYRKKKKIHSSQGSIHMIKGEHVYNICIVRSLQGENSCFKVKIRHSLKVKLTCHKVKKLCAIFGITFFTKTACPFLLIHQKYFLKIEVGFAFYVHDLFQRFILTPHLPLRNRRLSVSCTKSPWAQHWVFNGIGYNREECIIQISGSNLSLSTFS